MYICHFLGVFVVIYYLKNQNQIQNSSSVSIGYSQYGCELKIGDLSIL